MHADYKREKSKEAVESDSDESWIEHLAQALEDSTPAETTKVNEQRREEITIEAEEEASSEDALGLGKGLDSPRD